MRYKNFEPHELEMMILENLKKYYYTWGPSIMRQLRVDLNGYEYCRASSYRLLKEGMAERHKESCERLYPMLRACEHFAPNGLVRRKMRHLEERYIRNFGKSPPSQEIISYYALLNAFQAKAREFIAAKNRHPKQEPFKKYIYDKKNGKSGPPYKVLYPNRDNAYEHYRARREFKEMGFTKVLNYIDKIFAPDKIRKTKASVELRCR